MRNLQAVEIGVVVVRAKQSLRLLNVLAHDGVRLATVEIDRWLHNRIVADDIAVIDAVVVFGVGAFVRGASITDERRAVHGQRRPATHIVGRVDRVLLMMPSSGGGGARRSRRLVQIGVQRYVVSRQAAETVVLTQQLFKFLTK